MMMRQLLLGIFMGFILGVATAYYEVISRFGGMDNLKAALENIKTATAPTAAVATPAPDSQPSSETAAPQTVDK